MAKSNQQPKHIPMRTCVVCREKGDKRTYTRLVRTADGILVDSSGKMDGRGAYLCSNKLCWERAVKTDILKKALHTTLNADDIERLIQAIP